MIMMGLSIRLCRIMRGIYSMEMHYKSGIDWWQSYMWIGEGLGQLGRLGLKVKGLRNFKLL